MDLRPNKTVQLSAGSVRVRDVGEGPVLLFVHGLLVSGTVWRKVVPALAKKYRCVVPDWPLGSHTVPMQADADLAPAGIAKLVAELADTLDLHDVTLIGNDSGGAVCQIVAARHPERISRLVLVTCDALEVFPPRLFEYLKVVARAPSIMALLSSAMLRVPALTRLPIAYGLVSKRRIPRDVVAEWIAPTARDAGIRRDVAKFLAGLSPEVTMEIAKELPRFDRPVLLVWATEERSFPLTLGQRLASLFPNASLEGVDDCLVFIQEDQPEALVRSIASFASGPKLDVAAGRSDPPINPSAPRGNTSASSPSL